MVEHIGKVVHGMSALESQVIQSVYGQPEDILLTVLNYLKHSTKSDEKGKNRPLDRTRMTQSGVQRIGVAENEFLYDDSYDFDECNDKIAEMFGVEV